MSIQIKKRRGAPTKPGYLKKEAISIKLPRWLIERLDQESESRAVLIERAFLECYGWCPASPAAPAAPASPAEVYTIFYIFSADGLIIDEIKDNYAAAKRVSSNIPGSYIEYTKFG